MQYIFLDVETTGIARTSSILQFSALVCDEELTLLKVINEYYYYDGDVPDGAVKVHGLTSQKLEFLATMDFYEHAPVIQQLLSSPDTIIVGHNVKNYDIKVLEYNLAEAGFPINLQAMHFSDTLELCRARYPSTRNNLQEALRSVAREAGVPTTFFENCFSNSPLIQAQLKDTVKQFHSALYDTFMCYMIFALIGT